MNPSGLIKISPLWRGSQGEAQRGSRGQDTTNKSPRGHRSSQGDWRFGLLMPKGLAIRVLKTEDSVQYHLTNIPYPDFWNLILQEPVLLFEGNLGVVVAIDVLEWNFWYFIKHWPVLGRVVGFVQIVCLFLCPLVCLSFSKKLKAFHKCLFSKLSHKMTPQRLKLFVFNITGHCPSWIITQIHWRKKNKAIVISKAPRIVFKTTCTPLIKKLHLSTTQLY